MKATNITERKPATCIITLIGTKLFGKTIEVPLIECTEERSDYYLLEFGHCPEGVTPDEWDFMVEVIEYSINEGGDMQRELTHDDADDASVFPEFRYECVDANQQHFYFGNS